MIEWIQANWWRTATLVLGVVLLAGGAFALGGSDNPGSEAVTTTTIESEGPDGSVVETTTTSPDGTSSMGGFLAIKIDNAPDALPQVGIADATVLVEVPVEGGLTRLTAILTRTATGIVGPVRSLRPVDTDLLPALATVVVSTGGQPWVTQEVQASGIQSISPEVYEGFVSAGREIPHDTFIDLDALMPLIGSTEDEAVGLPAGNLPVPSASATVIDIPFGTVEYRYENDVYARYDVASPVEILDSVDGPSRPSAQQTVVVMYVAQRSAGYSDSNGAEVPTFDVIGSGELLVFHQGQVFSGSWSRSAQADPFVFLDGDGSPFGLPGGSTYLALVPRDLEVVFN
jgi:Protein of unknown function (DUF3048) N-terminal domain/Protein of unknown function (DUF3048) C-terminal domain